MNIQLCLRPFMLCLLLIISRDTVAQQTPEEKHADIGKSLVELPVEQVVGAASLAGHADIKPPNAPVTRDAGKMFIEMPVENLLGESAALPDSRQHSTVKPEQDNPTCSPGLVGWHSDWNTARKASEQSGKPVLLFQLLGQLDQTFT